jgi:hypothetical protein
LNLNIHDVGKPIIAVESVNPGQFAKIRRFIMQ